MKKVVLPTLLLILPLIAGCSEPEEEPVGFLLHVHNEAGTNLYERYFINGEFAGGPRWIGTEQSGLSSNTFLCDHPVFEDVEPGESFTFKLVMEFRGGAVFAEESRETRCGDEFAAWVHPDGYIVFEDTDTRYGSPPWE